nr:DUF6503 family protein [uncultured Allomuricauda sp.]
MRKINLVLTFCIITSFMWGQTAKEMIRETVEATGGKENFYKLKNVNYDIEYRTPPGDNSITFVGHETYVFDGELSLGEYSKQTISGASEEGYNGKEFWVKIDGKISHNEQTNGVARFLRKTNYYWFAMFFKLLDEGVVYEKLTGQEVNGKVYDRIKITFENNVGDTQDTYILYRNKETKLIDQFLFTITGFGITEPNLMTYDWQTIEGIKIPKNRKYIKADWDGNVLGKQHTITNWTNIQFNTDIDISIFNPK